MMKSFVKRHREAFLFLIDIVIICFAYLAAYLIRTDFDLVTYKEYIGPLWRNMPWAILINIIVIKLFHLERSLWRFTSVDEAVKVTEAVVIGNVIWWLIVMILPVKGYIRSVPVIAALLQLFFMLGLRIVYRLYRRSLIERDAQHRAVIFGAGSAGVRVLREISYSDKYNTRIIGFIDNNGGKIGKIINGKPVLGGDDDLKNIVEKYQIDTAYIAIRNISRDDLRNLIDKCQDLNLRTQIVTIEFHNNLESISSIRNVNINDLLGRGELHLNNTEISNYLTNKTVMVTGAGGSIGSELVRQILHYHPKCMVLMDIYENTMYDLQQEINIVRRREHLEDKVQIVCLIGSVRDRDRLDHIIGRYHPDVVYHAAAHKHVPLVEDSPLEALKNNVFGTYNVIQACIAGKVPKFVMISTDKAVRTTNVMGATKRMCELIVEAYKDNGVTNLCAVRFGNVLGSHGSVIPLFEKQIENGGPVTVTDPNMVRYFMTIPEAAQLVLQASTFAKNGEIFILDMGRPVHILDLAKKMIQLQGFVPGKDIKIEFTGLRPGEKMYEELLVDTKTARKTANNLIFIVEPETVSIEQVQAKLAVFDDMIKNNEEDNKKIISVVNAGTAMEDRNEKKEVDSAGIGDSCHSAGV